MVTCATSKIDRRYKGGRFLNLMSFLVFINLLDNLRRYLKEQWFSLWCQTRSSLSPRPKSSLVDHRLAISSLVISAPTTSVSISSKCVGIWYGILVRARRYSPSSRISSWPEIRIFQVNPQEDSLVHYSSVANMDRHDPFWYLTMSLGERYPMEPYLVGGEGSDRASESSSEVSSLVVFLLGGTGYEVGSEGGGFFRDSWW